MMLPGRQRSGNKVVHNARGGSFLRFCAVLLAGASSMLIPIPSTFSLQGQLLGAQEPGADALAAAPQAPHAVVIAQPTQCAQLGYDEPATATVEAPGREGALFDAHITRLVPNAAPAGVEPACQIELELRAPPAGGRDKAPELANALPPGAAVSVLLPAHPRNWLTALVDQAAGDPSSTTLRTQLAHAYSYVQAQAEHFAHDTELGKNLKASIKDILKPEDSEDDE
jgi:hypothetical protein